MVIRISSFGPIKEFEFNLDKDLTVIYGSNNIGKSYAMQVVYLLLKNLLALTEHPRILSSYYLPSKYGRMGNSEKAVLNSTIAFLDKESSAVDITGKVNSAISERLSVMAGAGLKTSFLNTFGDLSYLERKENRGTPRVDATMGKYKVSIIIREEIKFENFDIGYTVIARKIQSRMSSKKMPGSTYLYYNNSPERFMRAIEQIIREELEQFITTVYENVAAVYFLPASRSGIYSGMSAFGQIIAELSKNRSLLTKKIELPGISEPISDYFISLTEINTASHFKLRKGELAEIAEEIEAEILKGEVRFDDEKKSLLYKPGNMDVDLEMTSVSSMVSEMSPVVAFLKYIIARDNIRIGPKPEKSKSIIFIEEPEAHLHPENQVKLIQAFSKLINCNVKLIITSHSNYIFNKLNNMILSQKLEAEKYCPIILTQKDNGSISKLMDIDELGVSDENFIDVSEALYEEREKIIEELNSGVDEDDCTDKE